MYYRGVIIIVKDEDEDEERTSMGNQTPLVVDLYTCPTGGWVLGNRHTMEAAIREDLGQDVVVRHGVAAPFTAVCAINGKKGKREIGPFLFCLPAFASNACCDASVTGRNARLLADSVGANPPAAVEMAR